MTLDAKGLATRRAVLGDAYVDNALSKATPFTAPLHELVTRHAWGGPRSRLPGYDTAAIEVVHAARLDMGERDRVEDESLGLNSAWYADVLMALTND
jgi:hypothetical protein